MNDGAMRILAESLTERIENFGVDAVMSPDHRVSIPFGLHEIAKAIHHLAEAIEGKKS